MIWIIGFLTAVLVLNCLLLMLLVLIQLPKKEAGLGTAFGGSTTDALFGAGTGNVLTKVTKYATAAFFVLTCTLYMLNAHQSRARRSSLERELGEVPLPTLAPPVASNTNAASAAVPAPISTNLMVPAPTETPTTAPPENAPPPSEQPDASSSPQPNALPADSDKIPAPEPPEQPN